MPEFRNPSINYVYPTISDNVGPSAEITVRFSIDIDQALVNTDTELNKHVTLLRTDTDTINQVAYRSYSDKTLRFVPSGITLEPSGRYQITVYDTIKSVGGRPLLSAKTWYFEVGGVSVGGVSLVAPSNESTVTQIPVFTWNEASYSGSYTLSGYHIQVDTTLNFASPDWDTTVSGLTVTPAASAFASGATYYWRVRGYTDLASGGWSTPWSFYYGLILPPSLDTRTAYPEAREFYITDYEPANQTSNLSALPAIKVYFNVAPSAGVLTAGSGLVTVTRYAVDYDPEIAETSLTPTLSISGTTLNISLAAAGYQVNRRYVVYICNDLMSTGGYTLPSDQKFFFTSKYQPMYAGTVGVRDKIGPYVDDVSDDLINFHIYKQSLRANNAILRQYYGYSFDDGGPTKTTVMALATSNPPENAVFFVEAAAAASVLRLKFFKELKDADRTKAFPDYRESGPGGSMLSELRQMIKALEGEAQTYWSEINTGRAYQVSVVKSEDWMPQYERYDYSRRGHRRTQL